MGAAWSSPPWMKTSNRWNGPSALKPKYYQLWADYHLRFLQLMQKQNISFWAISTGNEPMNGVFGWIAIKWLNLGWLPSTQVGHSFFYFYNTNEQFILDLSGKICGTKFRTNTQKFTI
jgi:O-glycosyl hydrolase